MIAFVVVEMISSCKIFGNKNLSTPKSDKWMSQNLISVEVMVNLTLETYMFKDQKQAFSNFEESCESPQEWVCCFHKSKCCFQKSKSTLESQNTVFKIWNVVFKSWNAVFQELIIMMFVKWHVRTHKKNSVLSFFLKKLSFHSLKCLPFIPFFESCLNVCLFFYVLQVATLFQMVIQYLF